MARDHRFRKVSDTGARYTGYAKLNGATAIFVVILKHVLDNFDDFCT